MKDFIMKKFLVLSLLIHASIICSSSSSGEEVVSGQEVVYIGPKIAINLIDQATRNIPEAIYEKIYDGCCNKNTCYANLIQEKMQELFELGKQFSSNEITKLKSNYDNEITKLKLSYNKVQNQSLIEFLNSYSKPAKIGFGVAGAVALVSLVYSVRQLYLFSRQKYSDWKAKKEESE